MRTNNNRICTFQVVAPRELVISELVAAMEAWLRKQRFRTQVLQTCNGGTLIQIEKEGRWRKVAGMSTALNVVLTYYMEDQQLGGGYLNVEVGEGRWLDKVAGGTVGFFLLWPFLVTAAIGTFQQSQMPKRVFDFVGAFFSAQNNFVPMEKRETAVVTTTAATTATIAQIPQSLQVPPSLDNPPPTAQAFCVPNTEGDVVISNLERLSSLRDKGVLTDQEFLVQKNRILNS